MALLAKEEIVSLIGKIRYCEDKNEEEIDKLIKILEQGVLDPEISDYIFWSEMSPEEIAEKVRQYKPIEL